MPVCECDCVNKCDFLLKVVYCWGLFWLGMVGGRKRASATLLSIILVFPLKFLWVWKLIRGFIGSSGNVRVGGLARGLLWWNMGKLVFPGEWRLSGPSRARPGPVKPMFMGPSSLEGSPLFGLNIPVLGLRVSGPYKPANLGPKIKEFLLIILFFFCFRDIRAPWNCHAFHALSMGLATLCKILIVIDEKLF